MSSPYNTIVDLEKLADELRGHANELDDAAETLRLLQKQDEYKEGIKKLKKKVREWLK